ECGLAPIRDHLPEPSLVHLVEADRDLDQIAEGLVRVLLPAQGTLQRMPGKPVSLSSRDRLAVTVCVLAPRRLVAVVPASLPPIELRDAHPPRDLREALHQIIQRRD